MNKGFMQFFEEVSADVFCVQETKMQPDQAEFVFEGYTQYWNSAVKKGYSGTAVFTRIPPLSVSYNIGVERHGDEGRVVTLEFERFYLVNVYTPNSQRGLLRLDYRMDWEDEFRAYVCGLNQRKPVVICGDMNVAHNEIDLKNPKSNRGNAGFSDEEREKMTELLSAGFVDSFRCLYPELTGAYTWWSYMGNARANNTGWRIDYFLVSQQLAQEIKEASIHPQVQGSDHCPVELVL